MLVPFSSSSFHPLINRLETGGFPDLLASYSIYFCFSNYFYFICFQCLSGFFNAFALVSIAYIIIGLTAALYVFDFVFS